MTIGGCGRPAGYGLGAANGYDRLKHTRHWLSDNRRGAALESPAPTSHDPQGIGRMKTPASVSFRSEIAAPMLTSTVAAVGA